MSAGRYRLTLCIGGRRVMRGWWASEAVARLKFAAAVGRYGGRSAVSVTVVDDEAGRVLTTWPDEP